MVLTIALIAALTASAAAAAPITGDYSDLGYQVYTCFGDSISAGYGLADYVSGEKWRHVDGSYPVMVADALGVKKYNPYSLSAMRTVEMRMFLEDDFYGDKVTNHVMYYFVEDTEHTAQCIEKQRKMFRDGIRNSDLLSLQLGFNDVWFTMLGTAQLLGRGEVYTGVDDAQDEFFGSVDRLGLGKALKDGIDTLQTVIGLPTLLPTIILAGVQAKQQYFENYKTILKEIYALNPDVTIAAIGYYNPVKNLRLGRPQGLLDLDFGQMNDFLKEMQLDHENFYYVPVEETETRFETTLDFDMHPTEKGHVYMAQQMLNTLPKNANPLPPVIPGAPDLPDSTDTVCAAFTDINTMEWYHNAVHYVLQKGIMSGTTTTTFSPDMSVTRGMMAQMIYAMEGRPATAPNASYRDVPSTMYYASAAAFVSANGIMTGYDGNTFGPEDQLTREQLATVLRSYAVYKKKQTTKTQDISSFNDASSVSFWAKDAVAWAVASGLMAGRDGGMLAPLDPIRRCEVAQMVMNFNTVL